MISCAFPPIKQCTQLADLILQRSFIGFTPIKFSVSLKVQFGCFAGIGIPIPVLGTAVSARNARISAQFQITISENMKVKYVWRCSKLI